jgi:hypothetical protein
MKPAQVEVPAERAIANALAARIGDVLRDDLVGIYLTGSAVTGGFDPGVSDLDLVVVTTAPADEIDLSGSSEPTTSSSAVIRTGVIGSKPSMSARRRCARSGRAPTAWP